MLLGRVHMGRVVAVALGVLLVSAPPALAEKIADYRVDIAVNPDATFDVVEKIVYDFEDRHRHGIYREMPTRYTTDGGNRRTIKIKKLTATVDGKRAHFVVTKTRGNVAIKVGDADATVTGTHTYVLRYRVLGAINTFPDHAELYWNAIGTQWNVAIANALVNVTAPHIVDQACFSGTYGSRETCRIGERSAQRVAFAFSPLAPGEGATVVVGIAPDAIAQPAMWQRWLWFAMDNGVLFLPLAFLLWGGRQWWKYGRDPVGRGTIIPYYDVPDHTSVAEAGAIVYNGLRARDISAMIIQLAVKGFIKITREEYGKVFNHTRYIFTRLQQDGKERARLTAEEAYLLEALFAFGDGATVTTDDLEEKFAPKVSALKKMVSEDLREKGYLPKKAEYRGVALIIVGVVQMIACAALSALIGSAALIAGIVSLLILVGFALAMGHRTAKGVAFKEKLLGLKLYIETVESDRLRFHNAPAKNPQRFEKLLPYAMVFGAEKEWAQQFKDIYTHAPEWYEGAQVKSFDAVVLASHLRTFDKVATDSIASTPSSAGSGRSGFSGGGTGGGFGGGGGGSW